MTERAVMTHDEIDEMLVAYFRPVPAAADLGRRALDGLRDEWDPERFVTQVAIEASDRGVTLVRPGGRARPAVSRAAKRLVGRARDELFDYLEGRRSFFSVPVDFSRLGPFQREVLALTHRIPFGETRSYSWIARIIGRPEARRAVGTALGRNPVPIIVPCHRVLRSDGALGGYAFGLSMKTRLLGLEQATPMLEGCSTTRVVCRVGCRAGRRMRDDSRVVFASVADARSVGYRPCAVCRPRS